MFLSFPQYPSFTSKFQCCFSCTVVNSVVITWSPLCFFCAVGNAVSWVETRNTNTIFRPVPYGCLHHSHVPQHEAQCSLYIQPSGVCISVSQLYVHTVSIKEEDTSFIPSKRNKMFSILSVTFVRELKFLVGFYYDIIQLYVRLCDLTK